MKNKIFILVIVICAIAGFIILKNQNESKIENAPSQPVPESARFIRPHSPSYGNPLGHVRVVQWFDPECESCRMIHPVLKKIISDYKDRVHFVFRYMPYHGNSMFAAAALEEARELGKYDAAMDVLFENQPQWGSHHDPRPDLIPGYLTKLGIPADRLEKSYLIEKHGEKIRLDESDGKSIGVRGTPTFFVNEQMLSQLGEDPLRAAIEAALKQ
ncbi:MAG: DsbA family protein [Pseudobdellovibrionaceae bacterium]